MAFVFDLPTESYFHLTNFHGQKVTILFFNITFPQSVPNTLKLPLSVQDPKLNLFRPLQTTPKRRKH